MKSSVNFKNIVSGLRESILRFPAAILMSAATACVLVIINETQPKNDLLGRLAMVFALGIPVFLCIKLYFERKNEKNPAVLAASYASGGLLIFLYFKFFLGKLDMTSETRYIAVSLALYMLFLIIPYFNKKENFEMHVIAVFTGFLTAAFYSAILFSGLSAIIFALQNLLQLDIKGDFYYYSFLFSVFIFGIPYFFSEIPKKDADLPPEKFPRFLRILLLYIVMPLLLAYTVILYLYFSRFVAARAFIKGPVAVSHLILWYGSILTVVLFFITPIRDDKKWTKYFSKIAPIAVLPPIAMLFAAIGIRINAYGFTERRYYVVALGIWLALSMAHFIVSRKNPRNIIIPAMLAVIAIFSVFGPLSSYSVSIMSQNSRLEKLLSKNGMVENGAIKAKSDIPKEDKMQISSIIEYFNSSHELSDIKLLPKGFQLSRMKDVFGFELKNASYPNAGGYYFLTREDSEKGLDISGYDFLIDGRHLVAANAKAPEGLYAVFDYDTSILTLYNGNEKIFEKDLNDVSAKIAEKYASGIKEGAVPAKDMDFVYETGKYEVKIMFSSISGNIYDSRPSSKGLEFYVLVKEK